MRGRAQLAAPQLEMPVDDPAELEKERQREVDEQHLVLGRFFAACREVVRETSWDHVANQLEAIWGPLGRHVSSGVLKLTLSASNGERNYFRWEWSIWFARNSEACADLLAEIIGRGRPKKDPADELRDLKDVIRNEYPKQAERLIRKGETK